MKLTAFAMGLLFWSASASAQVSAEDLLAQCASDAVDEQSYCAGYLAGAIDVHRTSSGKDRLCLPENGITALQAYTLLSLWIDTRPTERKESARTAITLATTYAYACSDQVKADIDSLKIPVYGGTCNEPGLQGSLEYKAPKGLCARIQPLAGWIPLNRTSLNVPGAVDVSTERQARWEAYYRRAGWTDNDVAAVREGLAELADDPVLNDPKSEQSRQAQREYRDAAKAAGWSRAQIRQTSAAEFAVAVQTFYGPDGKLEDAQRILEHSIRRIQNEGGDAAPADLPFIRLSSKVVSKRLKSSPEPIDL